jgi:hypothetical protein
MAKSEPTSAADLHPAPSRNIADVIINSATEAFGGAIVLWLLGGAFDDLGVPNLKTLARWTWRRMRKRKPTALPATAGPD